MGPIRQRKALSCVDCRKRKVKCDRTLPVCVRCQKSNNASNCTYVPYTGPNNIPTPSDGSPNVQREGPGEDIENLVAPWSRENPLERAVVGPPKVNIPPATAKPTETDHKLLEKLLPRVIELETYVRSAGARPVSSEMLFGIGNPMGPGYQAERNPMSDYDKVMVRGKSFSTQYFGPSFPISMLLQFDELSMFVKNIIETMPELSNSKKTMATIRAASKAVPKETISSDIEVMISMVPPHEMTDKLIQQYLEYFETTYRVLHVPSFMKDYELFWRDPHQVKQDFVVQLLLAVSTMFCVLPDGPTGFVGRSSAKREVVVRWLNACDLWVEKQSKKHMTLSHLQIHVLLFISRGMNCIKIKREWSATGQLLRLAMSAGMHREPSLLCRKINNFDCEMRRRLWFTIVELDLRTATDRGMMPGIDSMGWDCLPPNNIHDEEFDKTTEHMPPSRPRNEFTRTSFLHYINEHTALRAEILGRVNSIRLGVDFELIMQFDNKLRKVIDDMPNWQTDAASLVARNEAKLQLWEFILILHVPFASQTSGKARYLYSVASRRDASLQTLKIYSKISDVHRLLLSNSREDYSRASLALCHDIVTSLEYDPRPQSRQELALISNIVDVLADRVSRLGQGFHSFWITTTAYALAQWKLSGEASPTVFAREAAKRVVMLFDGTISAKQQAMPALNGTDVVQTYNVSVASETAQVGDDGQTYAAYDGMNGIIDPAWDFMNFDFSSVWDLDPDNVL